MSALDRQVGGDHYKGFEIQPVEYIHRNDLNFLQGCVVKRISRFNKPTGKGVQDLEKIKHEIDLLIELERHKESEALEVSDELEKHAKILLRAMGVGFED